MPKFLVTFERDSVEYGEVEIEAPNIEEALTSAEGIRRETPDEIIWSCSKQADPVIAGVTVGGLW